MYVNYYTRELMNPGDNPPLVIILCADKNDAIVKYTLPAGETQIFAAKYLTYLPTEEELRTELLWLNDSEVENSKLPAWEDVERREYYPWKDKRILINTAHKTIERTTEEISEKLSLFFEKEII